MAELEQELLASWEQDGTTHTRVDGLTVYINQRVSVSPVDGDYERACQFLAADDNTAYLVQRRFNAMSMAAWVREQEALGSDPEKALAGYVNVNRIFELRTRK